VEEQYVCGQPLSLDLDRFAAVLRRLARIEQTLMVGDIEEADSRYFDTAASSPAR
jgi:hypothetical protein